MTRLMLLAASLAAIAFASPATAQKANSLADTNQAALRQPSDASLVGALHEFAWERGALYAIQASPQRITDIALEPGEALLSVSAGDTTRWIVGDAHSGAGPDAQAHVLVKPNAPGLSTNLIDDDRPSRLPRRTQERCGPGYGGTRMAISCGDDAGEKSVAARIAAPAGIRA